MTMMFPKITLAWVATTGLAMAGDPKAPTPPTEVDAMAKAIVGIWKCAGTETAQDGSAKPITGKITAKLDLEKWWINDVFEGKGARGNFKLVAYSTFDSSSKKWRRVSVDSMGHQYVGTSDGMKDGKLTWNLDFLGTMGSGQFKDTLDTTDQKGGVKFAGSMSMDKGKTWKPVYEMTCKK
jgi:hypothetical protein